MMNEQGIPSLGQYYYQKGIETVKRVHTSMTLWEVMTRAIGEGVDLN